eukprot:1161002-Pelagomonas_calceolata.AAC.4
MEAREELLGSAKDGPSFEGQLLQAVRANQSSNLRLPWNNASGAGCHLRTSALVLACWLWGSPENKSPPPARTCWPPPVHSGHDMGSHLQAWGLEHTGVETFRPSAQKGGVL